ncbi:MAG: colicin V family bacteriocin, partial [Phycisphaerae bacterium]
GRDGTMRELTIDELDFVSGAVDGELMEAVVVGAGTGAFVGTLIGGPKGAAVGAIAGAVAGGILYYM